MDLCKSTPLGKITLPDWVKALIVAVISGPLDIIYQWASTTPFTFDWKQTVKVAIAGGVAYIIKNLLTGANGQILTNAPPKQEIPK